MKSNATFERECELSRQRAERWKLWNRRNYLRRRIEQMTVELEAIDVQLGIYPWPALRRRSEKKT